MYYFYVLKSSKDNKHYYGSSSDLKRRIGEHQGGKVNSTTHRLPMHLIYYEAYLDKVQAQSREATVKRSVSARRALLLRLDKGA